MDRVAEGHGKGEGVGGGCAPSRAKRGSQNYFYIVKCIGAKND